MTPDYEAALAKRKAELVAQGAVFPVPPATLARMTFGQIRAQLAHLLQDQPGFRVSHEVLDVPEVER